MMTTFKHPIGTVGEGHSLHPAPIAAPAPPPGDGYCIPGVNCPGDPTQDPTSPIYHGTRPLPNVTVNLSHGWLARPPVDTHPQSVPEPQGWSIMLTGICVVLLARILKG